MNVKASFIPLRKRRFNKASEITTSRTIVLAGTPNAGKTTLFNALTGSHLKTGNWHGVTVFPSEKSVDGATFVDVPGMYSFETLSMEEGSAASAILKAEVIVNVVDALTLENNLSLTRQLIATQKPVIVYVTKVKFLHQRGGFIDEKKLSALLGVPVVVGDVAKLKKLLFDKNFGNKAGNFSKQSNANLSLVGAYGGGNFALSKIERLFYNRYFALFAFVFSIVLMFFLAFSPYMPGALGKQWIEQLLCVQLPDAIRSLLHNELMQSLVCEGILGGVGGVLSFVPQIAILYLFLTLLDESGIMSALSFATDGIFQKCNLSGRAAFTLVSGFGCTAAAMATTRGYFSKQSQRRTVAVLAFIPCGAKLPVFLTLLSPLFANPFPAVCVLYFAGILLSLLVAKLMRGEGEELFSEVTPIAFPSLKPCLFKLLFYVKGFIIKVTTTVMLFCVFSWVLSHFDGAFTPCDVADSMLAQIAKAFLPLFRPMGVESWQMCYALLTGAVAKENIAASIAMLLPEGTGLTLASALSVSVFVLLCPACISAFAASKKEVGARFTLVYFALQLLAAFAISYVVYFIFGWFI